MSQDQQKFQPLSPEDVISVLDIKAMGKLLTKTTTFTTATTEELRRSIRTTLFSIEDPGDPCCRWFEDGVKAKVLIAEKGGGWKVGRVRLSIEFLPDEPTEIEASTEKASAGLDEFR